MRLYDLIGAIVVLAWVTAVGLYTYELNFATQLEAVSGSAVFREGESWMILTREDEEIGYLHETRTSLDEGWLLEYDFLMSISMLGVNQLLETNVKAKVDRDAYLQTFNASVRAAKNTFDIQGHVEDTTVVMAVDLAGIDRERRVDFKTRPRLSNSAMNQLIGSGELEPGQTFEQEFFDPTVAGTTKMKFEYVREHDVEVFGTSVHTYHFRQLVAGTELDIYVDKNGEVYIQEFPLRIIAARLPNDLGRARALALRRTLDARTDKEGVDLSVAAAVGMLRGGAANLPGGVPTVWEIKNIPESVTLQLASREQTVVERKGATAIIDTSGGSEPVPLTDELRAALLAPGPKVDSDSTKFAELRSNLPAEASPTLVAEQVAQSLKKRMKIAPNVSVQTATMALEAGEGDCTELSLTLVAGLRHHGIPSRFVFGVKTDDQGRLIPHQWAQYYNGQEFVDLDLTMPTLLVGNAHIQLLTGPDPDHPDWVGLIDGLEIAPHAETPSADFN